MTVQAGVEFETDLDLLVGDMPAIPCESKDHGTGNKHHDDGPATHYAQFFHPCHGSIGEIRPVCHRSASEMQKYASCTAKCRRCGEKNLLSAFMIVLSPITR
ncbi:hypothetical protein ACIPY0_20420 [Paenarthrobacter nicotinovorans]|uniref:hypothetical protein n=1 Tax=Paenarthrobacter nicotinovorans TaxID=29320 RepID=UPI00381345FA